MLLNSLPMAYHSANELSLQVRLSFKRAEQKGWER